MFLKIFITDEINLAFDHKSLLIGVTKLWLLTKIGDFDGTF
jgi:hypothetical protein